MSSSVKRFHSPTSEKDKICKGPRIVLGRWQLKIQSLSSPLFSPDHGDIQKERTGTKPCTCFFWCIKPFTFLSSILQFKGKKTRFFISDLSHSQTYPLLLLYPKWPFLRLSTQTIHASSSSMQTVFSHLEDSQLYFNEILLNFSISLPSVCLFMLVLGRSLWNSKFLFCSQ